MHKTLVFSLRLLPWVLFGLTTAIAEAELLKGSVPTLQPLITLLHPLRSDFALYYRDSLVALKAGGHDIYDPAIVQQVTANLHLWRIVKDPGLGLSLPPLIWFGIPFALLPFKVAYVAWMVLMGACLVGTWIVVAPGRGAAKLLTLAAAVFFIPALFAFSLGQATLLILGVLGTSWWLLRSGHPWAAGVVLALVSFKPQLAFLVPVALLITGRRSTFLGFAGASGLMAAVAAILIPPGAVIQWVERLFVASRDPHVWNVNTSLTLMGRGISWLSVLEATIIVGLGLVALLKERGSDMSDARAYAIGILGSLLLTPYLHYEDLAMLLLVWWLFIQTGPRGWQGWIAPICLMAATLEPFGLPLTRLAEMLWLASFALTPLKRPILQASAGASRAPAAAQA